MGLTRRSESNTVFLQVRDFSLWQEIKQAVDGCDVIEVTNPKTKQSFEKYGYKFHSVVGRAIKLEKYDRTHEGTRYFGFKLHLKDGAELFVLDMPYQSQILRRLLKMAPSIAWNLPLSIAIFKGKKKDGGPDLAVWIQQRGETIKQYFTRENPHGMPEAYQDPETKEWDFKTQHRWLVEHLKNNTIPDIEMSAANAAPPPEREQQAEPEPSNEPPPVDWHADDQDVPF